MIVIDAGHSPVVRDTMVEDTVVKDTGEQREESTRRPWVAPTWERRDTPMEVTMYAGQR